MFQYRITWENKQHQHNYKDKEYILSVAMMKSIEN